jgi:hypothetical protein
MLLTVASTVQVHHTHDSQPPVDYIRQTSLTFRESSSHFHNCQLLNTFSNLIHQKNFFEKTFQAKTKTLDYGVLCSGTGLHVKEMHEISLKVEFYNSSLEGL